MLIRHGGEPGLECRLGAALFRWDRSDGTLDLGRVAFSGLAWRDPDGRTLWGWPGEAGRIELRPADGRPEECCLLPTALALALAIRRSRCDMGAVTLVTGEGIAARIARAVAAALGCRVSAGEDWTTEGERNGPRAPVVIETTGHSSSFGLAVERCSDWGNVLSLGEALTSTPFDYYPDVHRRALTVMQVPDRPILLPGEESIAERASVLLIDALQDIRPGPCEVLEVQVFPERASGRLLIEPGGWGLLRVEGP